MNLSVDQVSVNLVLIIGFLTGMLHATDADHLLTVSSLATTANGRWQALMIACCWAAGHGLMLMVIGFLVIQLNWSIPEHMSTFAELGVAAFLFMMGGYLFYSVLLKKQHLHIHQHEDQRLHVHWHAHREQTQPRQKVHRHQHDKKSFVIGGFHGLAGSAPVLALIPALRLENGLEALNYLFMFSLGVIVAMLLCGGFFSGALNLALNRSEKLYKVIQCCVGSAAMICGGLVLSTTL